MSFDAQMVLREAEAPVARPILLLISFSELLSHDKKFEEIQLIKHLIFARTDKFEIDGSA